jgi:hypothetical protein
MNLVLENTLKALKGFRADLTTEKKAQLQIQSHLDSQDLGYTRHQDLGVGDIPDFFHLTAGIIIEVKIKGSKIAIFNQCVRYCQHDQVTALIICTSKAMGFPGRINGKPCYYICLGKAWL